MSHPSLWKNPANINTVKTVCNYYFMKEDFYLFKKKQKKNNNNNNKKKTTKFSVYISLLPYRVADYSCTCPPTFLDKPFGGKNCTTELIGCHENQCQNEALCIPHLVDEMTGIHNYMCQCRAGWVSYLCDVSTTVSLSGQDSWLAVTHTDGKTHLDLELAFRWVSMLFN